MRRTVCGPRVTESRLPRCSAGGGLLCWRHDHAGCERTVYDDEPSATLPCPECGAEIYEDADRCPACGASVVMRLADPRRRPRWWVVVVGALVVLLLLAYVPWWLAAIVVVAALALCVGYLPAALGWSKWLCHLTGIALVGLLFLGLWISRREGRAC